MTDKQAPLRKSTDYRTVYANGIGIQFMGIDGIIKFSILDDITNPSAGGEEQVAVAMNVQNLKALSQVLAALVAKHEELTGATIELDPRVAQSIQAALASVKTAPKK